MLSRRRWLTLLILAVLLLIIVGFPLVANADSVVFSNLGPGNTYLKGSGIGVWGITSDVGKKFGYSQSYAVAFMPSTLFNLTQISVAISWISGFNGVTLTLNSTSNGRPGTVITTWNFFALPSLGTTNSTLQTMTFSGIILQPGQTYWIVASPYSQNTHIAWNGNSIGAISLDAYNLGHGWGLTSEVAGAFQVLGKPAVPEPSTLFLLGNGLLGIAAAALRGRNRSQ
jgi:hypothetical protein